MWAKISASLGMHPQSPFRDLRGECLPSLWFLMRQVVTGNMRCIMLITLLGRTRQTTIYAFSKKFPFSWRQLWLYYPHLNDEKSGAQRGYVTIEGHMADKVKMSSDLRNRPPVWVSVVHNVWSSGPKLAGVLGWPMNLDPSCFSKQHSASCLVWPLEEGAFYSSE